MGLRRDANRSAVLVSGATWLTRLASLGFRRECYWATRVCTLIALKLWFTKIKVNRVNRRPVAYAVDSSSPKSRLIDAPLLVQQFTSFRPAISETWNSLLPIFDGRCLSLPRPYERVPQHSGATLRMYSGNTRGHQVRKNLPYN